MATAEIITIGTELLLGEIQDTNTYYLVRQLRQLGINVFRTTIIGDNPQRIVEVINESLERSSIVITTGGLGPTVDDPTRQAAATSFGVDLEFHPDLWQQIRERFEKRGIKPTENNKKQAFLPAGAKVLLNPVGTAPAFFVEQESHVLVCLPGVPSEMEFIFQNSVVPALRQLLGRMDVIKARVLHTCSMGESSVDNLIADLETLSNPTVGLCAHPGIVDIRITAKAATEASADEMIAGIESVINARLPDVIFGIDDTTLPMAVEAVARKIKRKIFITYSGFSPEFIQKQGFQNSDYLEIINQASISRSSPQNQDARSHVLGVNLKKSNSSSILNLTLSHNDQQLTEQRSYNGPPSMSESWAINNGLGYLWQKLTAFTTGENNE